MQALSSYNPQIDPFLQHALQGLEDPPSGLVRARGYFSERGIFAKFIWADWPEELSGRLRERVEVFHGEHPELRPVGVGSEDWRAIFRWASDPASANEIARLLAQRFEGRVRWVEAERDVRGRIAADCFLQDVGEVHWDLSWRHGNAVPVDNFDLKSQDLQRLSAAFKDICQWAGSRIQPILDALNQKLRELYGDRFRGLYVFGSYARPDAGIELPKDSDLDVALLLSDFRDAGEEIQRFGGITAELSLEHDLVISMIPIQETEFRERSTNFTRVISESAVPVE